MLANTLSASPAFNYRIGPARHLVWSHPDMRSGPTPRTTQSPEARDKHAENWGEARKPETWPEMTRHRDTQSGPASI